MDRVYTQTFGVVAAIIEQEGKFLLVKEASTRDKGKWNHPAGWIDVGENPTEAVVREVKEETGLEFEPKNLLGVRSLVKEYPDETHHGIKLVYSGNVTGGHLIGPNEEIAELKWFSPEEINRMAEGELRDPDIKGLVENCIKGKKFPLEVVSHKRMILK